MTYQLDFQKQIY